MNQEVHPYKEAKWKRDGGVTERQCWDEMLEILI